MTAPDPEGRGAASAMRMALRSAGVDAVHVGYVNAHATGTRLGDVAECKAVRRVLRGEEGGSGAGAGMPPITMSSTKGAVGHLLGAAGAVEALFTVLAVREGVVPPTLNLDSPDVRVRRGVVGERGGGRERGGKEGGWERGGKEGEGEGEGELNDDDNDDDRLSETFNFVPHVAQRRDVRVALSNSFGFGGTNACLCFRRWEE